MKTMPTKTKATLVLDTAVCEAIKARVGVRGVGAYLSKLAHLNWPGLTTVTTLQQATERWQRMKSANVKLQSGSTEPQKKL